MSKHSGVLYETKKVEGVEQAAALVIIPTHHGNFSYLCYRWGSEKDVRFFDTITDNRIIVPTGNPYILHCPAPGMTYEMDGGTRELRSTSSLVVN